MSPFPSALFLLYLLTYICTYLPTSHQDMDDVIPSNGGAANVRSRSSTPAPRANTPLAPGSVGLDIDEDTPSGPAKATAAATAANGGAPPSQEDMFFMQQATEKVCIHDHLNADICISHPTLSLSAPFIYRMSRKLQKKQH